MAQTLLFKVSFRTGVHIGTRGIGVEEAYDRHVPSDTLYGAILSALVTLHGIKYLDPFKIRKAPFLISSMFPTIRGEILLVPKPMKLPFVVFDTSLTLKGTEITKRASMFNRLRKCEFIDMDFIRKLCNGILISKLMEQNDKEDKEVVVEMEDGSRFRIIEISQIKILIEEKYVEKVGSVEIRSVEKRVRNALDRVTRASNIYYAKIVHFHEPMYFLIHIIDERIHGIETYELIKSTIKYLGDKGLGGERTLGHGRFEVLKIEEVEVPEYKNKGGGLLCMGLYAPSNEDWNRLDLDETFYEVESRGGWSQYPPSPRSIVHAFKEGSVIVLTSPYERISHEKLGTILVESTGVIRVYKPFMIRIPKKLIR